MLNIEVSNGTLATAAVPLSLLIGCQCSVAVPSCLLPFLTRPLFSDTLLLHCSCRWCGALDCSGHAGAAKLNIRDSRPGRHPQGHTLCVRTPALP